MSDTNYIPFIKGYKATNADMTCMGFQFELGKLYEHEGDIKLCKSGFHFCEQPSGVWSYYNNSTTRIFEIEAYDVSEEKEGCGTDIKRVAKKIKFVREININGDCNTGSENTGHRNTGDRNTGHRNTGDRNTGHCNTGHYNTGHRNTGDRNTGDRNTGSYNTGSYNTGHYNTGSGNTRSYNTGSYNTGHRNTGHCNTGSYNTGHHNTGDGNVTNYSSGFFCMQEPKVISFDIQTDFIRSEFLEKYPEVDNLTNDLLQDVEIDYAKYANIPGITEEKLIALHNKFKEARKK